MSPMATAYHLRPVKHSPSPTPTSSSGPYSPTAQKTSKSSPPRARRPLSPSSLRDLDLTNREEGPPRSYPAPPTGHELMAMFPPAPPEIFPEMRPGPTSVFFQGQERAFFAKAGKEIVRVRVEIDLNEQHHPDAPPPPPPAKSRRIDPGPSSNWSAPPPRPHHQTHHRAAPSHGSPAISSAPQSPYPLPHITPKGTPSSRPADSRTYAHPPPPPPPVTNGHAPSPLHRHPTSEDLKRPYPDDEDPDERWRRPMPYAERRRAGKHTRRVVVKTS